jgi:hypothetical protein
VLRPQAETQSEQGKATHKPVLQMEETQMLSIQSRSIVPNKEQIHEPIPKRKPIRSNLLAANGPAEANLNVPRKFQPRKVINHRCRACQPPIGKKTNTNMNQNHFRGNKHPFWRSRDDNHSAERDKLDNFNFLKLPSSKLRSRQSSTTQHCTNQSKDTVTQRETANQHPTK